MRTRPRFASPAAFLGQYQAPSSRTKPPRYRCESPFSLVAGAESWDYVPAVSTTVLVGRLVESKLPKGPLDALCSRELNVVVWGKAGIGKTALVSKLPCRSLR